MQPLFPVDMPLPSLGSPQLSGSYTGGLGLSRGSCGLLYLRLGWGSPGSQHPLVAVPARTWVHTLVLSHVDGRLPLPTELNPWRDKELLPESPGSAEVLLCWIEGTGVKGCGGSW